MLALISLNFVVFYLVPAGTTAQMNYMWPTRRQFPSSLFCDEEVPEECPIYVAATSAIAHTFTQTYLWGFLLALDLLQMTFASYMTSILRVSVFSRTDVLIHTAAL